MSINIYSSYSEAMQSCPNDGYNSHDLVNVVVEKNRVFRSKLNSESSPCFDLTSIRTLLAIGLCPPKKQLNILDFGGGSGFHYLIARASLPIEKNLKWAVVETRAMTKLASTYLSNDELQFFDSLKNATANLGEVDLVFASSSLQYCENPLETLEQLVNIGAKHIFITRTPFSESDQNYISIQKSRLKDNGPGIMSPEFTDSEIAYPITFMSQKAAEKILMKKYKIRFSIKEGGGAFILENNQVIDNQFGYFCDIRN